MRELERLRKEAEKRFGTIGGELLDAYAQGVEEGYKHATKYVFLKRFIITAIASIGIGALLAYNIAKKSIKPETQARRALMLYDTNGDGKLDKTELTDFLNQR